jgi:hypothetical protein
MDDPEVQRRLVILGVVLCLLLLVAFVLLSLSVD